MKHTKNLIYLIILLVSIGFSKNTISQNSCANSYTLIPQNISAVRSGSLSEAWYEFTANEDTIDLEVNSLNGTLVNKIELYSGSCGSLTRIGFDTISNSSDSVLRIYKENLVLNNVYKVKLSSTSTMSKYDLMLLTVRGPFLIAYDVNQIPYSYCVNQNGIGNNQIICGVTGNCNLTACPTQTLYFKLFLNNNCNCTSGNTNWYFSSLVSNISNLSYLMEKINICPGSNPFVQVVIPSNASGGYLIWADITGPCMPCQSTGTMTTAQFSLTVIPNFTTSPIVSASPICENLPGLVDFGGGNIGTVLTYTYGDLSSGNTPVHTYTSSGTYTVTKQETAGFCTGQILTDQIQVTPLAITVSLEYVCGTNINLTKNVSCNLSSTGIYHNNTWSIINSSGTTIYTVNSGTNTTINYVFPANGTYTVVMGTTVFSGPNAGTYSDTQVIVVNGNVSNPTPVALSASTNTICLGQSSILTVSGASTYTWSTGVNTTTISVNPTVTTTYSVIGTNPCGTNTAAIIVSVIALPSITAVANPTAVCLGNSSVITASGASTYTWSNGTPSNSISVTPSVTTIYTVTGTSSAGCINTKTVSLTVKSLPSLTLNPAYNAICIGASFTITASGASTYSWNTGATTPSIAVITPAATKEFTVIGTGSNGCSSTKTYTLYVNPLPTLTVVATPTIVCFTSSTLSASGANTYTWSNSATTSTTVVSPSVTTTYTVTGTSSVGCVAQKTISLTYGPTSPTITVNSNTNIVCSGSTTLTASGGASYTWSPGGTTTATIAVSPTVASIYTVTSTYGPGCGAYSFTTMVNPVVSTLCCSAATSTLGTSLTNTVSVTAGTYTTSSAVVYVQGCITFTANTSYSGYTFRMAPGASIRVHPNKTLTLTNCKLYSCSELWDGIYLMNDFNYWCGNIIVTNSTIEDMYNGIVMDYNNMTLNPSAPSGTISITGSTLNKNYVSVQMRNNSSGFTGSATNNYLLSLKTSTISSYASTTSPGISLKPSSIATYTYAYNDITNGTMGTSAPYLNFPRTFIGIKLNELNYRNNVIVGDFTNSSNTNTFDNLDFGVNGTNVTTKVYNNYFKNITGSPKQMDLDSWSFLATGPDEIGIAVAITETTTANAYAVIVGNNTNLPSGGNPFPRGNKFEDCNKGIKIHNVRYATAKANYFTAATTSTLVQTTMGTPPMQITITNPNTYYFYKAQNAEFITAVGTTANMSYNYIRNHATGIYANHTVVSSSITPAMDITDNDIAAPSSTGYCMQAIQTDQAGGINFGTDKLNIYNNTITQVYRGIIANSVLNGLLIKNNAITVEGTSKTLNYGSTSLRTGVILNNCQYGYVKGNSFTQNGSLPTTTTTAQYINGVYVTNSTNTKVECNSATTLGRCFVFQQSCAGSSWKVNAMSGSYTGLELRTGGVIGQQGASSGSPNLSANTWTNVTRETNAVSSHSVNSTSVLYLRVNSTGLKTEPTLNFASGGSAAYSATLSGIQALTSGTSYTCNSGSAQRLMNGDTNTSSNNGNSAKTTQETDTLLVYSLLAVQNEADYEFFPEEMTYLNKQSVFKLLDADSIQAVNGTVLDHFYQDQQNSAIDKLTDVQKAIANDDVTNADAINSTLGKMNTVEYKHQRANELVIKYMQNHLYAFSPQEMNDLFNMASECIAKGYYVVQCRNLVNIIQNTVVNFDDNCEEEANTSRKQKAVAMSRVEGQTTNFYLYPNPNNGSMILDYDLGNYTNAKVNVFDITGKVISTYKLSDTKGILQMNEQNLNNGVYFYRILIGEKIIKTDKIVIIK